MDEITRRSFLKAAGLAVAGVAGVSLPAIAQEQEEKPKEKEEEKREGENKPEEEEPNYDDLFGAQPSEGEETRACPQCGALMYRQGRTWTCETCGYSYVE